jgi:thiamine-phosphate pyrophosphorylase
MSSRVVLYYITDRSQFPGGEAARRRRLFEKLAEAARYGVDYVQLREKDLATREMEALAASAVRTVGENSPAPAARDRQARTRVLINSRTDIAIAAGADGVHLRSYDVPPSEVRQIWSRRSPAAGPGVVAISCHSTAQVAGAAAAGIDFAVFAPVFEKHGSPGVSAAGLGTLRQASQHPIPVLALGGITLANACACLDAGAAGIAAVRLFQDHEMAEVVQALRGAAGLPAAVC